MRVSYWSSALCFSDLYRVRKPFFAQVGAQRREKESLHGCAVAGKRASDHERGGDDLISRGARDIDDASRIGRVRRGGGDRLLKAIAQRIGDRLARACQRCRSEEARSEERRVGKEGVSTCRSRWSP